VIAVTKFLFFLEQTKKLPAVDLKHRYGLLEAIIAGNPTNLQAVLGAIELQFETMRIQAIEHYEKPQSTIAFVAQRLALRQH
jgi:hypothetical protein